MSKYVLQFSKVHPDAKLPIRRVSEYMLWSCRDRIIGNNIITILDTGLTPVDLPIDKKIIVLPNQDLVSKDIKLVSYTDGSDGTSIKLSIVRNTIDPHCFVLSKGTLIGYFIIVSVDIPEISFA